MKTFFKILISSLFAITAFAQQATELDPKFVKLPRYADLTAINTAIPMPTRGMMVYNIATASNWYYNGTAWTNTLGSANLALPFNQESSLNGGSLFRIKNNGSSFSPSTGIMGESSIGVGIFGKSASGVGVFGTSVSGNGGEFRTTNGYYGILVRNENTLSYSYGIKAEISGNGIGVEGFSPSGAAIKGVSQNGIGGQFESTSGPAANFINETSIFPTVRFRNDVNLGTAIDIQGGIKVSGTNKAAFKIVSVGGVSTNIYVNQLIIPNTSLANHINDIVLITHNYGAGATNNFTKPCGVFWEAGTSTWRIYVEDGTAMPVGITFNVLVIKQ